MSSGNPIYSKAETATARIGAAINELNEAIHSADTDANVTTLIELAPLGSYPRLSARCSLNLGPNIGKL